MSYIIRKDFIFKKFPSLLIILLPVTLVTGPFLPDLSISIISILFIFLSFKLDLKKYYSSFFFKLFLLFYILINISSLLGSDPFFSFKNSFFYFRYGLFALYFWYLLDQDETIKYKLFYSFVIVYSCLILDGFTQYFVGKNILGWPIAGSGRISSFFGNELILGSYLSRLFPLIFCLLILIDNKKFKFIKLMFIFTLFLATDTLIFLSGERTALFLVNLSTFYIIFFVKKFKYLRLATYLIAIVLIIFISSINSTAKKRVFDHTFQQMGLNSDDNEKRVWKQFKFIDYYVFSLPHEIMFSTGLKVFNNNKLFGVGPKNFRTECKDKKNYIRDYSCNTHPHNTYIQLLSETGIFAFLIIFSLFVWLVIKSINIFISKVKRNKIFKDEIICIYACFLMTLWPIVPTGSFFTNWMCIVYFFPVGIYLHLKNKT